MIDAIVLSLGDVQRCSVVLAPALNGPVSQGSSVEFATSRHPTQAIHIAKKDLVCIKLEIIRLSTSLPSWQVALT